MIIKEDEDIIEQYTVDATNFRGEANKVVIPESKEEIKEILIESNRKNIPITVSGAGTGLAGSRVPLSGTVLSMERLNRLLKINCETQKVYVQTGITLNELQQGISHKKSFYPPDPTEINSSIGGNISTNASGARTFKYGPTRKWIDSLKIITIDGEEIHLNRETAPKPDFKTNTLKISSLSGKEYIVPIPNYRVPKIKHSAGYYISEDMDALDLFIGSEGTLGVIYEAGLKLQDLPEKVLGLVIFFEDMSNLFSFVQELKKISKNNANSNSNNENSGIRLDPRLIEYFDNNSLNRLKKDYPQIPNHAVGSIWIEQEYLEHQEDELLSIWFEEVSKYTNLTEHIWTATNPREHHNFKEFRHCLPLAINEMIAYNHIVKIGTDTTVPHENFPEYFKFMNENIEKLGLKYFIWGHIGNDHVHINILTKTGLELRKAENYSDLIIKEALRLSGTVSAEHGIGKLKKRFLLDMYESIGIFEMKAVKRVFDPNFLLGAGNLF